MWYSLAVGLGSIRTIGSGAWMVRDPETTRGRLAARYVLLGSYAINAFADHFLTDLFSAGHLRAPRRALWEMTLSSAGESGLLACAMHNEDCTDGLHVSNARGDRWMAYGDRKEFDDVNVGNVAMAITAVQASADEVRQAADGHPPEGDPAALKFVPNLNGFAAIPKPGGPNHASAVLGRF